MTRDDQLRELSKILNEFDEELDAYERNWCDNILEYRYHSFKLKKLIVRDSQ